MNINTTERDAVFDAVTPILGSRSARFVQAGMQGLQSSQKEWLQVQILLGSGPLAEQHRLLRSFVCEARTNDRVRGYFFVHKPPGRGDRPPGVRLRIRIVPAGAHELETLLLARLAGIFPSVTRGVYEPEEALFGGATSMEHVHDLFRADSDLWLALLAADDQTPRWVVCLVLLKSLLAGLEVVGWEDLGVFERLRDDAGRSFGLDSPQATKALNAVVSVWQRSALLQERLTVRAHEVVGEWESAATPVLKSWRERYLSRDDAVVGARQFAALLTVFTWNRSLLSTNYQCIIATALADHGRRLGSSGAG